MLRKRSLQESIERMKYVSKYVINESPKYKSLVGDGGFDRLPEYLMREEDASPTGDTGNDNSITQEPLPEPTADVNATPAAGGEPQPADVAPVGAPTAEPTPEELPMPDASTPEAPVEPAPVEDSPEKRAMELQLDALRKMSYKIEDIGNAVDSLNKRMEIYSSEVEEVREPSDMEKFDNRKSDSHPYYFNLNDLWDNNNFKARMDQFSKGYVKTEDGYVADFDDLPKLAPHEVKASFDGF